jgi:hypothetical protein
VKPLARPAAVIRELVRLKHMADLTRRVEALERAVVANFSIDVGA